MAASLPGGLLHGLLQAASLAATFLLRQPPGDSGPGAQTGRQQPAAAWQLWGERGRPNRHHRILAGLFAAFVLALTTVLKPEHSPEALAVFLEAEAAIVVFLIGIPLLASDAWLDRNHLLYSFACRLALANAGSDQQHSVSHTLQAEPSTGRLRLLSSTWQLFLGTKSFALLCLAVIAPLPLLPHLLLAVVEYRTLTDVRWACHTPMLRHPAWQGWIQSATALLDNTPMAVARHSAAASDPEQDCRRFVTLFQLVCGVVVPALCGRHALEATSRWRRSRRRRRQPGGGGGSSSSSIVRALDSLRMAAEHIEWGLHWVCDRLEPRLDLMLPLAWATMLSLLWTVALVLQWPQQAGACAAG